VPLAMLAAGLFYWRSCKVHALTEKHTIHLSDFINTTGDPVFDGTLKQALAVNLQQSPFLYIVPDKRVREVLQYKLGESLASIEKFGKPMREVTTSSLEGLKAYSRGRDLVDSRQEIQAISLLPLAYVGLARASVLAGDTAKARSAYQISLLFGKTPTATFRSSSRPNRNTNCSTNRHCSGVAIYGVDACRIHTQAG
jgi:hypothetical protein